MTEFLAATEGRPGPLEIEEVFLYYDGPVLFSTRDDLGHAFIVVAANQDGARIDYLCVPVSEERLRTLKTGSVSLRDAFGSPERSGVFVVSRGPVSTVVTATTLAGIDQDWLPDPGEFLTPTAEVAKPFALERLAQLAEGSRRYLLAGEKGQDA